MGKKDRTTYGIEIFFGPKDYLNLGSLREAKGR
jgi:hypothetical protein